MPKAHPATIYGLVILGTVGEFTVAGLLAFTHGDVFPLYLATLYFIRERWSGYKFIAVNAHKAMLKLGGRHASS